MSQCFKICWTFLGLIDFYAISPSSRITFQNNRHFSSWIGRFLTLLTLASFIGAFIYFGLNMMMHKNPNTIIAEQYQSNPDYLNITKENFFMAFGMRNNSSGSFIIDESIYIPEVSIISKNKSMYWLTNETKVTIGPCEEIDKPKTGDLAEYFSTNSIEGMYCIKDYYPVEMMGSEDSPFYEFISMSLNICLNNTAQSICKPAKDIESFANGNEFVVMMTSFAVDPLNYETPFDQHGSFLTIPTNTYLRALLELSFQHLIVNTDDGLVFQNENTQKGQTKSTERIYYDQREDGDPFVELIFNVDKVLKVYERTYAKLQEVLANTGGAIQIITLLSFLLSQPFVYFNFYRDLGNEYFEFEIPTKGMNDQTGFEKKKLEFSLMGYFFSFFRRTNATVQGYQRIWNKSKEILDNNLSLSKILSKIVEIEKIKYFLFDEDQLTVFESMPKPVISANEKGLVVKDNGLLIEEIKKFNEKFFQERLQRGRNQIELKNACSEIIRKKMKSQMDLRILQLVELDEKKTMNDNEQEDTNYLQILSKSDESELNFKKMQKQIFHPYIDTSSILKDLQSLKKSGEKLNK